jgi:hypothetical protein
MKQLTVAQTYAKAVKADNQFVNIKTIELKFDSEIVEIVKKRRERSILNQSPKTVKQFCDQLIIDRLRNIAKNLPSDGFSMGSVYVVSSGSMIGRDDRTQEYANSCKYRANHGRVNLILHPADLRNTVVIGGLITHIFPDQKSQIKKCYWYVGKGSKNNFQLTVECGFIFAGFHAKTKEAAKIGGQRNIDRAKEEAKKAETWSKALRLQYSYADSINAGNCEAGTKAFALRHNLNTSKKYRGAYLLNLATGTTTISFVERMIRAKVRR